MSTKSGTMRIPKRSGKSENVSTNNSEWRERGFIDLRDPPFEVSNAS